MSSSSGSELADIDRHRASEGELLAAAGSGDREAVAELVERFTPLVRRIAGRLHSPGGSEDLDDLMQVGQIGLLEAISRFQPERGPFAAYASVTISGTIKRHFRDRGWKVRIPRSLHDASQKIGAASVVLEGRLGRRPTDRELAGETGVDPELLSEAREMMGNVQPLSLQSAAGPELPELGETLGSEDPELARAETRGLIGRLSAGLGPRDRRMLALRFGLDRTQVEIAEAIGVSQMQVSRLLRRALTSMGAERSPAEEGGPDSEPEKLAA